MAADEFLMHYSPVAVETAVWSAGEIELTISSYITCDEPPSQLAFFDHAVCNRGATPT